MPEIENRYRPWESMGLSELDYWKMRYLEARKNTFLSLSRLKQEAESGHVASADVLLFLKGIFDDLDY